MSKKHYTEEFKREVIEYSLSSAKPVKTICKEFGITSGSQLEEAPPLWRRSESVPRQRGGERSLQRGDGR